MGMSRFPSELVGYFSHGALVSWPMSKANLLQVGANYSFRSYFEMPNDTDEILAEWDRTFTRARLLLPRATGFIDRLPELQQHPNYNNNWRRRCPLSA
jgi:hypothetical protein